MLRTSIVTILIWASLAPVWAQRVVARVQAPEEQPLRFDVNEIPLTNLPLSQSTDLNFSPNIVFTRDSQRAFVSYPGSGSVVAFDTGTGEILAIIPVGENPSLATLTPDGTQIAVVSLFLLANLPDPTRNFRGDRIGSISLIDVDTYQVRTLELEEVFFSFANNIVFSEDGRTGYVASAGSDELLRFDVETLTEITPRLSFGGGTRPTTISMAPDRSFFTVVLVGSNAIAELETPDSIQIVDTASFSVIRSIVPEPLEVMRTDGSTVRVPHRFFATNTVAISHDGRLGMIGDRENSAGTLVGELAIDHALLLDLQTGEVLQIFGIGGGAAASVVHPTREVFLVLTAVDLSFIEPETRTQTRIGSVQSQFRATSRPAFSADGKMVYVASPVLDQLDAFDTRIGSIRNLVPVGRDFDSGIPGVTAGPQDVAVSPDGQVLAVLNFNANTIELLQNTYRVAIPEFLSTPEWFTGIALTSTGDIPVEIVTGGVARTGLPFRDDPETEDVVEFVNPQVLEIEPGRQMAFTARELIEAAPGQVIEGWMDIDSNRLELSGFFLTGDQLVRRLDGGGILVAPAQSAILPGIVFREGFRMELTILNSNLNSTSVVIVLVDSAGELVSQLNQIIGAGAVFHRFLTDPDPEDDQTTGLFDPELLEEGQTYYIALGATEGLFGYLRYYDEDRMASLNAIPVLGPDTEVFDHLYAPQVATFGGTQTFVALVNLSSETATVTLRLRGSDGQDLAPPVELQMETGQNVRVELAELFDLQDTGMPVGGWLEAESDFTGLVGSVEVQLFSGRAMTAVPMLDTPQQRIVFSHVAEGSGFSTGVALLHPGGEPANLTLSLHQSDGQLVGQIDLALAPGEQLSRLLRDLFGALPVLERGYILVSSDQPIFGLELFFTNDLEVLAAVPAQRLTVN